MKNAKTFLLFPLFLMMISSVCRQEHVSTKEARGIWVSRWEWAIKGERSYEFAQKKRIIEIMDAAQQLKFNFVVFQIRGSGDACYRSRYEPWSGLLTGHLGEDPGWDPLEFALEHAHRRGLEFHAWFNTFPAWRGKEPPPWTLPEHVITAHPEWLICDEDGSPMPFSDGYVYLSPGIPDVRTYIHEVAMDIVEKYDIDGIHFDYIRYPESSAKFGYSHDRVSVRLFNSTSGNPTRLSWADWQRENINQFVREFYDAAIELKPWLKISAAVIGKYDYSAWNGYHVAYQDGVQWLREGKMDFIAPMIYWQTDHPTARFGDIVKNWCRITQDRHIYPGMMINQIGEAGWPPEEIFKQISIAREHGNGMIFFSYSGLDRSKIMLSDGGFEYNANTPLMHWKIKAPPPTPRNIKVQIISNGFIRLSWNVNATDTPCKFNLFRSGKSPVNIGDARNLVHVTALADTFFYDANIDPGDDYYYAITSLDRVGNESQPSEEIKVHVPLFSLRKQVHRQYRGQHNDR